MLFGMDFFLWIQFVVGVLKLLSELFGDDDAKIQAKNFSDKCKELGDSDVV